MKMRTLTLIAALTVTSAVCAFALEIDDHQAQQLGQTDAGTTWQREIDLITGNVDYKLVIQTLQTPAQESLVQAIGLMARRPGLHFSKRGWYSGGFMRIELDGADIFAAPATVEITAELVRFVFATEPEATVVEFGSETQSEILFATVDWPAPQEGARISLTGYPGEFNKGEYDKNERWAVTAQREVMQGDAVGADGAEAVELEPAAEPWVFFYDRKNNPGEHTHQSTNAVLYNPDEVAAACVQVGKYSVKATLDYPAGIDAAHLMLWEFPATDNQQALDYMKSLVVTTGE